MVQNVLLVLRYCINKCMYVLYVVSFLQSGRSKKILSIDGNFGLCRKKAAGQSVRAPLHEGVFFEPQDQVDAYVKSYRMPKSSSNKVIQACACYVYIYCVYACVHIGM